MATPAASPEAVQPQPAVDVAPVEVRNARTVGPVLETREVREEIQLPVPRQARPRVEHQVLKDFDPGQPELVSLGRLQRCLGAESRVGVRVVVDETKSAGRLHAERVAKLHVLDVVDLDVAVRRSEGSEELAHERGRVVVAEATGDERLVGVGEGLEHIGLLQDTLPLLAAEGDTEVLPDFELALDAGDGGIGTDEELALDDVLEPATDASEVARAIAGHAVHFGLQIRQDSFFLFGQFGTHGGTSSCRCSPMLCDLQSWSQFSIENGVLHARFVCNTPFSLGSAKLLRFDYYYSTKYKNKQ